MKYIYTIGFTKKDAKTFFTLLKNNDVQCVLDIRLSPNSQLAGFTKGNDLKYFLKEILNVEYRYDSRFAPTKELRLAYRTNGRDWTYYEREFNAILMQRKIKEVIQKEYIDILDGLCLLCSEEDASKCHRRLVAELMKKHVSEIEIIHLR